MSAIKTALNADHGTNACYDLSDAAAVRRGDYLAPPRLPFACVGSPDVAGQEGPVLGRYRYTATVTITAWAPSTSVDLDVRCVVAELLMSKLIAALDTARSTAGNALRDIRAYTTRGASFPGEADAVGSDTVYAVLIVEFEFDRITGLS